MPDTRNTVETDLSPVAMEIIIAAGDGRKLAFDAVDAAAEGDFDRARELLSEAHKHVQHAHRIHTDQIQAEASGSEFPYSVLFSHAQDTLMTVNTEYRVLKKTVAVFERLDARIGRLEQEAAR